MYTAEHWHIIEKENNKKSAMVTSAIMLVLFLLLFFWVLGWPREKDLPLSGMMIDFGTTETGQGDNSSAPAPSSNEEEVEITEAVTAEVAQKETPVMPEKVVTQNVEKAPAVTQKTAQQIKAEKAAAEAKKKAEAKAKAQAEADALKEDELDKAWGKGKDEVPGTKGKPDGVDNGGDGWGTGGSGDGLEGFGNRKWEKKPNIENKSNNYGRVVLKIKVDKLGNIISAEFSAKSTTTSSTTTNSYLVKLAITEVMRQGKLSPDPNAKAEHWGYYTFNFKAR
jgi:outer membrane biosynthesis protein TonB